MLVGAEFDLQGAPAGQRADAAIGWSFALGSPATAVHGVARIAHVEVELRTPARTVRIEVEENSGERRREDAVAYEAARELGVAQGPPHLPSFAGVAVMRTAHGRETTQQLRGVRLRGAFPTGALFESSDVAEVLSSLIVARAEAATLRLRALTADAGERPRRTPTRRPFDDAETRSAVEFCRDALAEVRLPADAAGATERIRERLEEADEATIERCMELAAEGTIAPRRLLIPGAGVLIDELRGAGTTITSLLERHVSYLSARRQDPSKLTQTAPSGSPMDIGGHGEHLASVLSAYGRTPVEECPVAPGSSPPENPSLSEAVDYWASWLGVVDSVSVLDHGPQGTELRVRPRQLAHDTDLANVGAGVGSLVPVLVMCLLAVPGSVALLEEPELHLHPAVQQRLADFFLACARSGRQIVVETHSEPFVTRLRRRVAEGERDETLELVALLFAERHDGATRLEPVALNSYGGLNSWPEGFFDGQADDLEQIVSMGAAKLAADTGASTV